MGWEDHVLDEYCPPGIHSYTLKKHLNTKSFLTFSGGIEKEHWNEMG